MTIVIFDLSVYCRIILQILPQICCRTVRLYVIIKDCQYSFRLSSSRPTGIVIRPFPYNNIWQRAACNHCREFFTGTSLCRLNKFYLDTCHFLPVLSPQRFIGGCRCIACPVFHPHGQSLARIFHRIGDIIASGNCQFISFFFIQRIQKFISWLCHRFRCLFVLCLYSLLCFYIICIATSGYHSRHSKKC